MPIRFTVCFVRQYEKLPKTIQKKVDRTLFLLESDFRHPGLRSHPLEGVKGIFEAYVDSKYRMTFERRGEIFIMRCG